MANVGTLFTTYPCPRLGRNIAFCNEPNQSRFYEKAKLIPVPCLYLYDGKCQYKGEIGKENHRRQPRIIETRLDEVPAYTDITHRIIYIDERLRRYPKLRKKVLRHEIGHLNDKTINHALVRDMRDYPKMLLDSDFRDYYRDVLGSYNRTWMWLTNTYYKLMMGLFVMPLTIFIVMMVEIFKINRKRKL